MRYRYLGSVRDHRKFDSRRPNGRRRITRSRNMPVYTYTTIDEPRANFRTDPTGINGAGAHGFLLTDGLYTPLNDPFETAGTFAEGINAAGQVVGYYLVGGAFHGFLYSNGVYTTIDDPLESVRKHQAGLQSFRSMRRIEASRRNASALR